MMYKKDFLMEFIGRTDTYCIRKDGEWIGRVDGNPIDQLDEHILRNGYDIGCYNIYGEDGKRAWCKWICIDIDAHNKSINKSDLKNKLIRLYENAEDYFQDICDKDYLIIEETENGYHVWILLDDKTWATDAWKFVNVIKPNINKLFGMEVEFFPKQEINKFSINKYGNQVKLPYFDGRNNIIYKPIIIKKLNLKEWRRELNKKTSNLTYRKSINKTENIIGINQQRQHEIGEVADCLKDMYNMDDWIFGKCFKNVLDGSYHCSGTYGHLMRVATANELLSLNKSPTDVIQAFKNQDDYDPSESYKYVLYSKKQQEDSGRDLCFQCSTIRGYGYCDPDCTRLGVSIPINKQIENMGKPQRGSQLTNKLINKNEPESWDEVFTLIHELIKKEKGSNYIIKTTRSGTTTATLAQCIQDNKKVLMVAPTKMIYKSTVKEALDIWNEHFPKKRILYPKAIRIGSNDEECRKIKNKYGENLDEIKRVFPFILKPDCQKCNLRDNCKYIKKLDRIDECDIIFLTTAKFKALTQTSDDVLNRLVNWADIIFIDEFSYLIDMNYNSRTIYDGEMGTNLTRILQESLNIFFEKVKTIKSQIQELSNEIIHIIKQFVEIGLSHGNYENMLKMINIKESREEIFGDMDLWSKTYNTMVDFYLTNEDNNIIREVIMIFLAIYSNLLYIQLYYKRSTKDGSIYPYVELAYTDDMNQILDFVRICSRKKYVLLTDATIPYLEPHKIFNKEEDDFYVRVGDPNKTNNKQEIIVIDTDEDKFYYLSDKYKFLIDDFIEIFDKETFIICKNKKIFYYVKGKKHEFDDTDYYRGSKTVGVKNDLRNMAVIGSSRVPRHSYDCMAKMYKDAGYFPDISYVQLGQYLENHNAKSHFFQSISRVKDPKGEENSRVVIYGMRYIDVYKFLNELDLGHFIIKKMSLDEYIRLLK